MALVSDNFHTKKLNKYNINIKTKYIVGNTIVERNTDNSKNDDVKKGIRLEKQYYINNVLKHTEKDFDSRIEYTFVSNDQEDVEQTCPNCGMHSKLVDFVNGCPYCDTYYNIDYTEKDLGSKYHYDRILKNNAYRIFTAIIDLVISIFMSFIFIKLTSRTFNNYDFYKVFIYGFILSVILYYLFYLLDAYVVIGPIKKYKDRQNQKQIEFWNRTKIDKEKFFNNLNYEVRKYYYNKENVIDYDVLDYIEFNEFEQNNILYVSVKAAVRLVYFNNGKITSKMSKEDYTMQKHDKDIIELKDGANIIKCGGCGASVDVTKGKCEYCNTPIKYLQDWILVER